jgi:hypothetical protein
MNEHNNPISFLRLLLNHTYTRDPIEHEWRYGVPVPRVDLILIYHKTYRAYRDKIMLRFHIACEPTPIGAPFVQPPSPTRIRILELIYNPNVFRGPSRMRLGVYFWIFILDYKIRVRGGWSEVYFHPGKYKNRIVKETIKYHRQRSTVDGE